MNKSRFRGQDRRHFEIGRCRDEDQRPVFQHGISEATYYNLESRGGGMEASDVRLMKDWKPG